MKLNKEINYNQWIILVGFILSPFMLGIYRIIGYIGLGLILLGIFINTKRFKFNGISITALGLIGLVSIRVMIQLWTNTVYSNTVRSAVLQILTYLYIIGVCNSEISLMKWKWILDKAALSYFIVGVFLLFTKQIAYSDYFSSMYGNVLLVVFGVFLIDLYIDNNRKIFNVIKIILSLILIVFSEMRSALAGALIGVIYSFLPTTIINNKRINRIIFVVLMAICFIVPYIYLELSRPSSDFMSTVSSFLQDFTVKTTGHRFFSGRNSIWMYVLDYVKDDSFLGGGIGYNPAQIYETTHSAHNLFLFIRLEQGLVGLSIFVLLLMHIWNKYNTNMKGKMKKVVQAVFIAIMFQQTFSLGLLGGKGVFSFFAWAVLIVFTFGNQVNYSNNKNIQGV